MTNEAAETEEAPTATEEEVIVVDEQDHEKETDPEEEEDVFCPPAAAPPPPPPTRTTTSSSSSSRSTGETTTTTTIITTTSKVKCRHCARPARKGTVLIPSCDAISYCYVGKESHFLFSSFCFRTDSNKSGVAPFISFHFMCVVSTTF